MLRRYGGKNLYILCVIWTAHEESDLKNVLNDLNDPIFITKPVKIDVTEHNTFLSGLHRSVTGKTKLKINDRKTH